MLKKSQRYRWVNPAGKKGPWRMTVAGAVKAAVGTRYSDLSSGVRVSLCSRSASALWNGLAEEGWLIEQEKVRK